MLTLLFPPLNSHHLHVSHLEFNHTLHWGMKALHPPFQSYHSLNALFDSLQHIFESHTEFSAIFEQLIFLHFIQSLILQRTIYLSHFSPALLSFSYSPTHPLRLYYISLQEVVPDSHWAFTTSGPITHCTLFPLLFQHLPHIVGFNRNSMCCRA